MTAAPSPAKPKRRNTSKAKGTAAESAIVKYAAANGFAAAMRPALRGAKDVGDVWLEPGPTVIVESKSVAGSAALGQPAAAQFASWWSQTCLERDQAGADHGLLVVKRRGTTDVGLWWCWASLSLVAVVDRARSVGTTVLDGPHVPLLDRPMCLPFADALILLRWAGYGDEPEALTSRRLGDSATGA